MPLSNRFSSKNQPRNRTRAKIGRKYKGVSANKKFAAAARVARSPIHINEDGDMIVTLKIKPMLERLAKQQTSQRKRRASMAALAPGGRDNDDI